MFGEIFRFEVRYHLRGALFYICAVVFFLLTFGAITTDSVQIGGAIGNVHRNAPFVIMQISLIMSSIAVFVTTAFVANAIYRDFELGTEALFFATGIRKRDYIFGRFSGATLISFLVFLSVSLAIFIGSKMWWLDPDRLGPFVAAPYLFSLVVLVLPNIILTAAIFFSIAAITRNMLYTYAGVGAFFVAYGIAATLLRDIENEFVASLLDPFGFAAFGIATKYWTVFERNNSVMPLTAGLVANRILWLGVAATILLLTFRTFRLATDSSSARKEKRKHEEDLSPSGVSRIDTVTANQRFDSATELKQLWWQTRAEFSGVVRGVPFIVMLFLAAINIIGNSTGLEQLFGTSVYPVTGLMLNVIQNSFLLFALLVVTFYAGELAFRERSLKLSDVYDALPVPNWVYWTSKLFALLTALFFLLLVAMITAIGVQAFHGYTNFELTLYLKGLFLEIGVPFALITILSLFVQTVTNNKYVGFLVMVLYFVSLFVFPAMGWEHYLYRYAGAPDAVYSDMNGYGHFVNPLFWFTLYWTFFAVALLVVTHLFWPRGTETGLKLRARIASQRFSRKAAAVAAVALAAFAATGCFIYYNTNILNDYRTSKDAERQQADFEKNYKRYEGIPQPRITDVRTSVDIYPERRAVDIHGRYVVRNKTSVPIYDLHILTPTAVRTRLYLPPNSTIHSDDRNGYHIYRLRRPLLPGQQTAISFSVKVRNPGFVNSRPDNKVVANGTFINNLDYMPHLGYTRAFELQDPGKRKQYGLKPVTRYPPPTDARARQDSYLSTEADWITYATTVSTSGDQLAIAPGYLQKEWTSNGRRYFEYTMDAPILNFFSYLSARYEVKKDHWKNVAIEIDYDRHHPYNVDRMIDASKRSLAYFSTNFTPYQYHQLRIVEFPRYARFAQSFPNTIPFSESIGFIAKLDKPDDIDYVYYVTAHEVAHQWWAHQVIGANTQGSTLLSETLAQYSALMVMEKKYGREKMQRFLKYELDSYLRGRGGELVREMPLVYVEDQGYIHYRKGSLVMYELRDLIGEDRVNAALRAFLQKYAFTGPPYPTSLDLLAEIRKVTPPEYQNSVTDLFERITIYDNRATAASVEKRPDGKYLVKFEVEAKKFYANAAGAESPVLINDWIDVGILSTKKADSGKTSDVLVLEKKRMTSSRMQFEYVVAEKPSKAGIDPLNKLIDRNPEDNLKSLSESK